MSDIKEWLDRAAHSADVVPSHEIVEVDVSRGRAELGRVRRRRAIRTSIVGVAAASALTVGGLLLPGVLGEPDGPAGSAGSSIASGEGESQDPTAHVRLVSYSGEQLDGFIVDQVPEGWFLQGSREHSLTIAPDGDDTHPDNFVGKLVVMLLSADAEQALPKGEPVQVGDQDGVVTRHGSEDGATLTYEDGEGHFVQVQSPEVLGWTNEQVVSFAEGVEVTINAQPGLG